jgi:hypothetical protein
MPRGTPIAPWDANAPPLSSSRGKNKGYRIAQSDFYLPYIQLLTEEDDDRFPGSEHDSIPPRVERLTQNLPS